MHESKIINIFIIDTVLTEIQTVTEGGNVCVNVLNINLNSGLVAFWQEQIGSARNCECPIFFSTLISFSQCYCLQTPPNGFTVSFNMTTADLCWKNISFARNGSIVGIVDDQLGYRTFLKMIVILVEKVARSTSFIVQEHTPSRSISFIVTENIPRPTSATSLVNLLSK